MVSTGNVRKVPPPATEFTAPPAAAAKKNKDMSSKVIELIYLQLAYFDCAKANYMAKTDGINYI